MKKILTLLLLTIFITSFAQDGINYQGAATDNNGDALVNQSISLKTSILSGNATGTIEFSETHSTTTDQFGLFNVVIGQGNSIVGTLDDIDWGAQNHFLQVELDENGGSNYTMIATTQMMSVPYALYAKNSGLDSAMVANMISNNANSSTISISDLGDTLTLNGQSIIVPEISLHNYTPTFSSVTDIDGNTYQTVIYGDIEIMAENLKTEKYNNGDPIPELCFCGTNSNSACSTPGWTFYACQYNNLSYGRLYIGYTLADSRNVCPSGWHVATGDDWYQILNTFVTDNFLSNGNVDLSRILSSGSNESGLSILLGGQQGPGGANYASGLENYVSYWFNSGSSTNDFTIHSNINNLPQDGINLNYNQGFNGTWDYKYVRCVKD